MSLLLRCCGGRGGSHFMSPGAHLGCVNHPWRPHCWDPPAPLLSGRVHPAQVSCLRSWGLAWREGARPRAVVQVQHCPTKCPDKLWQGASKEKLVTRRKRSACSCPSNEWLGHNPAQRQAILQLLEDFLSTQGRKQKCPMQVR